MITFFSHTTAVFVSSTTCFSYLSTRHTVVGHIAVIKSVGCDTRRIIFILLVLKVPVVLSDAFINKQKLINISSDNSIVLFEFYVLHTVSEQQPTNRRQVEINDSWGEIEF